MTKALVLAGALLTLGTSTVAAQENVIKVNILSPIVKTGSFFFEHKINDNSSFQLGMLFTNWDLDNETKFTGFAVTPEYRFYLSEKRPAMEGFYVAPFLRYQNLTVKDSYTTTNYNGSTGSYTTSTTTDEGSLDTYGGGVLIGRQWIFKQRFSLDSFLGPSYNGGTLKYKNRNNNNNDSSDAGLLTGYGIRAGITFGIAF